MTRLGRRQYFILRVSDKNIESLIEETRSSVSPHAGYGIDIHSGQYGVNVVAEISGDDVEEIRKIDLEISSKVLEICEKRGIEAHLIEPLEIV